MENAGKEDMPEDAERQGLGTPATRAAMIEKLLSAGFVERKGKSLVPTKDGINLAVILPDMLKSPLLTAEWETRLTEIAKGSDDPQSFMQGIEDMTRELVKQYSHITEDGKSCSHRKRKQSASAHAAKALSMRARRISTALTAPAALSCGRMTSSLKAGEPSFQENRRRTPKGRQGESQGAVL